MSSAGGGATPTTTPTTPATPTAPATTPTPTTPTTTQQQQPPPPPATTTANPPPPVTTSVTTAPTAPTSTQIITSVITASPTQPTSTPPTTVVSTISNSLSNGQSTSSSGQTTGVPSASSTSTAAPASSGLSTAGKTAIAVIIPLAVVALLAVAGIFLWRRRSKKKADEEDRRKEMEAYGYNPNNDPSLPTAVKDDDGLAEDGAGYRGWGPTGTAPTVGRKTSTNASSGRQNFSDASTMYQGPGSPTQGTYNSDTQEQVSHHHRNGTMDSDTIGHMGQAGAAGAAGAAGVAGATAAGLHRGPSNASSTYSAGARSQNSNDYPIPVHNGQDYYTDNAYYQAGPYDNYGGAGGQPIMRESPARRLTQINEANVQPREGGIARNF